MSPARQAGPTTAVGPLEPDVGRVADGRATRWAGHRQARREDLVAQARRSVHHRGPDVSMEEIAADAGTSKSLVYRYFADKTALQVEVARLVVREIEEALALALAAQPTPREGLRAMVSVYFGMVESSPNVYAFVTRDGSVEHFLGSVTQLVAGPFARGLVGEAGEAGGPDAATTAAWAAGAVGFVRGAGEWWVAHRDQRPDREALAAQVTSWLWAGPVGLLARGRVQPKEEP
ncbi:MAG TPA: TetR/AcrR family transcriptional regulator [Cellulomonas sp.]